MKPWMRATPSASMSGVMSTSSTASTRRRTSPLPLASQVLEAEGRRDAAVAEAQGEQQARVLRARGEAEALQIVTAALAGQRVDAVQYQVAVTYLKTLGELAARKEGDRTVFLPYETSHVLAGIGGVQELLKGGGR